MSDQDDVRGLVQGMRDQAEIERRIGHDDIANRIYLIASRIDVNTTPLDKVSGIAIAVNRGDWAEAATGLSDIGAEPSGVDPGDPDPGGGNPDPGGGDPDPGGGE